MRELNKRNLIIVAFTFSLYTLLTPLTQANGQSIFQSKICTWKNNSRCAYTPTFDDSYLLESHIAVKKILQKQHLKATFFWDVERNSDWKRLNSMLLSVPDGFSVQSHTITHPYLTKLKESSLLYELEASRNQLASNTKQKILTLAYPYYDVNNKVIQMTKKYYVSARWGSNDGNKPNGSITRLKDPAIGINSANTRDYYRIKAMCPAAKTSSEVLDTWLNAAIKNGGWLVTSMHGLSDLFPDSWKSQDKQELSRHYAYVNKKIHDHSVWNDTFENISLYLRERNASSLQTIRKTPSQMLYYRIKLQDDTLDASLRKYLTLPLSILTYVPADWDYAEITQDQKKTSIPITKDKNSAYVIYDVNPQGGPVAITKGSINNESTYRGGTI